MKVTVFGTGYVGLVQGAVLADAGHEVICVDIDQKKIDELKDGIVPIYEPGLDSMIRDAITHGLLDFTTDAKYAVEMSPLVFIAVGTPPDEDGSADIQHVLKVAKTVAQTMNQPKTIVIKSTVPVGTADKVERELNSVLKSRGVAIEFDVVSNPEFLKEGAAVSDCKKPDRIIIGTSSPKVEKLMRELYAPFNRHHDRIITMSVRSAELTKYAANCMLATKISYMNEMSMLAEKLSADIEEVRIGIGSDSRIGYSFIYPGAGYGGSCFPKDIKAMIRIAKKHGYNCRILNAVEQVNQDQKRHLIELIQRHYQNLGIDEIEGKTFAMWGLAYKPQTDDIREATSRVLMEGLWALGAKVQAYDPEAMQETQNAYGDRDDLLLCGTKEAALKGADALIICTEWRHFWSPDFEYVSKSLTDKVIFDGRNIYDPDKMMDLGLAYYGIGRGRSLSALEACMPSSLKPVGEGSLSKFAANIR